MDKVPPHVQAAADALIAVAPPLSPAQQRFVQQWFLSDPQPAAQRPMPASSRRRLLSRT